MPLSTTRSLCVTYGVGLAIGSLAVDAPLLVTVALGASSAFFVVAAVLLPRAPRALMFFTALVGTAVTPPVVFVVGEFAILAIPFLWLSAFTVARAERYKLER